MRIFIKIKTNIANKHWQILLIWSFFVLFAVLYSFCCLPQSVTYLGIDFNFLTSVSHEANVDSETSDSRWNFFLTKLDSNLSSSIQKNTLNDLYSKSDNLSFYIWMVVMDIVYIYDNHFFNKNVFQNFRSIKIAVKDIRRKPKPNYFVSKWCN